MIGDKIFSGNMVLFYADENGNPTTPIGNVIEQSVVFDGIPDTASGVLHFAMDNASVESNALISLLSERDAEGREYTVEIQFGSFVLRPKNLKRPNKKRARRIWKKWAKRYGTRGGESILIPKAKVKLGVQYVNIIGEV